MKATLEFDLADPHDAEEHEQAVHGTDWALLVWDLDTNAGAGSDVDKPLLTSEGREYIAEYMRDNGLVFPS